MTIALPPVPPGDLTSNPHVWRDWFSKLRDTTSGSAGTFPWSSIDFTGSSISDILARAHSQLSGIVGGTVHLTSAEYTELLRGTTVTSVSANTALDDNYNTLLVTATGKTMTLPAASTARIGRSWTIILGTVGYVDITRAGSDTIYLPTNDVTIRLTNKGASVTLECLSATTWGIK